MLRSLPSVRNPDNSLEKMAQCDKGFGRGGPSMDDPWRESLPQGWKLLGLSLGSTLRPPKCQVRSCPCGAGTWGLAAGRGRTGGEK